jgi:hypothetical protein
MPFFSRNETLRNYNQTFIYIVADIKIARIAAMMENKEGVDSMPFTPSKTN